MSVATKILYIFFLIYLMPQSIYCQQESINETDSVDSYFINNFSKIECRLKHDSIYQCFNIEIKEFVLVISALSGNEAMITDYGGTLAVTNELLRNWKRWYIEHRDLIKWENVLYAVQFLKYDSYIMDYYKSDSIYSTLRIFRTDTIKK